MSLFVTDTGRQSPFKAKLTTGGIDLVTAGENGAIVSMLRIAEVAAATPTVTVAIVDADGVTTHILNYLRPFAAKESFKAIVGGEEVVLLKGEKLRATASADNQLHATGFWIEPPN
jgi:hypothetical protein